MPTKIFFQIAGMIQNPIETQKIKTDDLKWTKIYTNLIIYIYIYTHYICTYLEPTHETE